MSEARKREGWRRRLLTMHGKLVEIAWEIENEYGEDAPIRGEVFETIFAICEPISSLGGFPDERAEKVSPLPMSRRQYERVDVSDM